MPGPTIILFDVDGTLLLTAGAGRRAMQVGCLKVLGRHDACDGFSMAGMTDRAIARKSCIAVGADPEPTRIDALLHAYLAALPGELAKAHTFQVLAGVQELIGSLLGVPNTVIGLGTGNVRQGAELKLTHGQLWKHFSFGGFGCDAEERPALIRVGAERGAAQLGAPLDRCRVIVVGDTPFDVAAAAANRFESLAVATGGSSAEALAATAATRVVASLQEPGVAAWCLGG